MISTLNNHQKYTFPCKIPSTAYGLVEQAINGELFHNIGTDLLLTDPYDDNVITSKSTAYNTGKAFITAAIT